MFVLLVLLAISVALSPLIRLAVKAIQEKEISSRELGISVIGSALGTFVVVLLCFVPGIFTDYLWFKNLTFESVFTKSLVMKWGLFFAAGFVVFVLFKAGSFLIIQTVSPFIDKEDRGRHKSQFGFASTMISGVLALIFALFAMGEWQNILWYLNQVPAGTADPIFHKDISFYLFSLPVCQFLCNVLIVVFSIMIAAALTTYFAYYDSYRKEAFWARAMSSLSVLGIGLFGTLIWKTHLAQYGLLTGHHGVVFGAGYTDIHSRLFAYKFFIAVLAIAILVLVINFIWRKWKPAVFSLSGVMTIWLIIVLIIPACVQAWGVRPSELERETPYLEYNIQFTRQAFGLEGVENREFEIKPLTEEVLRENQSTLDNIRIWDWRALQATYQQTQRMRTYYEFPDIDIDRYIINGKYRQVMLAARELQKTNLNLQAQTWVNLKLVYTHGYGLVLNAVNEFLGGGVPNLLIKDIPPKSQVQEIEIARPEIYYGNSTDDHVFVNTTEKEFDYPEGTANRYCTYQETAGVSLGSGLRKLMFALRFDGLKLLLSEHLKADTQVLYYRDIRERLEKIAPFLLYDRDDYLVAENGKLYHIIDAYTVSSRYPYSEPYSGFPLPQGMKVNYIRNSVKAVVDAYTGKVDFYIFDETDPIVKTYQKTFPALFKSRAEMPDFLLKHIRYPEDLLYIQAKVYSTYHMGDPNVFYGKEDVWMIAKESYGHSGASQEVLPYYVIIKLAGENQEEFLQMIPFTPKDRDNLVAWMAGRADGEYYGKVLVYEFTKQSFILGTLQFESLVDQNPEMSAQFTLWSQSGSEVIRGNTLVIPVEDSLIYVEPVYLRSTQQAQMPTLTKVIVATQRELGQGTTGLEKTVKLEWGDTFEEALRKVMGTKPVVVTPTPAPTPTPTPTPSEQTVEELVKQANYYFAEYQRLTGEGKLVEAAQALQRLQEALKALADLTQK